MSQAIKKSHQDEDDSWLDDEATDADEPQAKRACLETSVSQLLSSAATNGIPSTNSVESGHVVRRPTTINPARHRF